MMISISAEPSELPSSSELPDEQEQPSRGPAARGTKGRSRRKLSTLIFVSNLCSDVVH